MPTPVAEQLSPDTGTRTALAAAAVSGGLVAAQQRVNGSLDTALGDPLLTATVSFGIGLGVVSLLVAARPAARRALPLVRTTTRLWERCGGLCGAVFVTVGALAAPRLGVALLSVGLVAGQTTGGVVNDRIGLGPGGRRALTAPRLAGALLCLVAVGVGVSGEGAGAVSPPILLAVVVAGFAASVQIALNGRVRAATGDATVATAVNFVAGCSGLLLALVARAALSGVEADRWPGPDEAYVYLGGPIGVVFVMLAAYAVRTLGVLRLGLASIAGQLAGAVLLDVVLPVPGSMLSAWTVAGAGLTLVAVLVSGRTR